MIMNVFIYKLKVNPNIKVLALPIITIAAVVIMLILVFPGFMMRFKEKMAEYKTVQSQEVALSAKLESLRKISVDLLDPDDITVVAFPSKDPSIWVVSQVRKLSNEYKIIISDMSVDRNEKDENFYSANISVEIEANEFPGLLSFLKDLTDILPVTSIENVSVNRNQGLAGDIYSGELRAAYYWYDFPSTLPPMEEPVDELTEKDMQLLGMISSFKQPTFIDLSPGELTDRTEPFN